MKSRADSEKPESNWYGVRCLFHNRYRGAYEERITLWQGADFEEITALAEAEAIEYAASLEDVQYIGLSQAFHMWDSPGHGAEVFSLMRTSNLPPAEYIDTFFSNGDEREFDL